MSPLISTRPAAVLAAALLRGAGPAGTSSSTPSPQILVPGDTNGWEDVFFAPVIWRRLRGGDRSGTSASWRWTTASAGAKVGRFDR